MSSHNKMRLKAKKYNYCNGFFNNNASTRFLGEFGSE